ncbi:hypothetical protein SUGI_1180800 [Cryptomeria japonica]|nr:hypothetical protein SUGI_1180800 [Cryptomeria japonica]
MSAMEQRMLESSNSNSSMLVVTHLKNVAILISKSGNNCIEFSRMEYIVTNSYGNGYDGLQSASETLSALSNLLIIDEDFKNSLNQHGGKGQIQRETVDGLTYDDLLMIFSHHGLLTYQFADMRLKECLFLVSDGVWYILSTDVACEVSYRCLGFHSKGRRNGNKVKSGESSPFGTKVDKHFNNSVKVKPVSESNVFAVPAYFNDS